MSKIKKIAVFIATIVVILTHIPRTLADYEAPIIPTAQDYLHTYSTLYGSSYQELYSVMRCESRGNQEALGDGGKATGVFQFWGETWSRYSKIYNQTFGTEDEFDINSIHDQIKLASFVFSLGENAKREWTTYRALKNGGSYTFTAHGKTYHIHCKLLVVN